MGSLLQTLSLRVAARFQASRPNPLDKEGAPMAFRVVARYKEKKQVRSEDGKSTSTIYIYSDRAIAERNKNKAKRLEKLSKSIKDLRAKVKRDIKSEDPETCLTALVIGLIDETHERVGSKESSEGVLNNKGEAHYGVTQWLKKHVSFKPNGAFIKYVGKSSVKQEKWVTDPVIRKALRDAYEAADTNDSCLFEWEGGKVTAEKVNSYLSQFNGITAKDLRGLAANVLVQKALNKTRHEAGKLPTDPDGRKKQLKKEFKEALIQVAEELGHEFSTLRSQYLVPSLESEYLKDGTVIEKLNV